MPVVTTGLSDAALASSAIGALPVSAGPGAVPVYDPNNFWDRAARQRKLVGHPVSSGGDRWNCQDDEGNDLHRIDKYGTAAGRATGANVVVSATVSNVSLTNNTATITTTAAHNFRAADWVVISGLTNTDFNGTQIVVTAPTATTFTFTLTHADVSSTPDSGSAVVTRKASVQEYQTSAGGQCSRFDDTGALVFERNLTSVPARWGDNASLIFRQSFNGATGGHVAIGIYDKNFLFNETTTKSNLSLQLYYLDDGSRYSGRSGITSQDRNKFTGQIAEMGGQTMEGSSCDINASAYKAQNQLNIPGEKFRYCYAAFDAADVDPNYPAGGVYSDRGFGKCKFLIGPSGELLWGNHLNPTGDASDPELWRLAKVWKPTSTNHLTIEGSGQTATTTYLDIYGPPLGNAILRMGSRDTQDALVLATSASSTGVAYLGLGSAKFLNFYNNPIGVSGGVSVSIGTEDNGSALTLAAGTNNIGAAVLTSRAKVGLIGDLIRAQDPDWNNYWRVNKAGYAVTAKNSAIADADLVAGECTDWWDSTNGASRKRFKGKSANGTVVTGALAPVLSVTATLDFGSTPAQSSTDLTISVTGAVVGDSVSIGVPAAPAANTGFFGWVSATDTITVRHCNFSSGAVDPASGTYRVTVARL